MRLWQSPNEWTRGHLWLWLWPVGKRHLIFLFLFFLQQSGGRLLQAMDFEEWIPHKMMIFYDNSLLQGNLLL